MTRATTAMPENVPLAPADLWVRRIEPTGLTVARWIALVALVGAPLTGSALLAALATLALAVQILTSVSRRGLFLRNLNGLPCLRPDARAPVPPGPLPGVTLVAPARNEEAGIEIAARSAMALDYPCIETIYIDDHSTDATGAILDRLATEFRALRVIHSPPPQEGWLGKANAVWHGISQSDPSNPWLVLADADVVFHPAALREAIAVAIAHKFDFLTCVAYIDNGSLSEELFMPGAWASIIQGAHFSRLNEPRTSAIGIGAFILVKRRVYLACGGHAAIRDRQPEDTLLAALVRKNGGNMGVCWTPSMIRVRVYRGLRQLRQFIARKIRMQSQDSLRRMANRIAYILIQDVLPLPLFVAACGRQIAIGAFSFSMTVLAAAALLAYITEVGAVETYRHVARMRRGLEWFHPAGGVLRIYFQLVAMFQVISRKGMEWRGRDFSHR